MLFLLILKLCYSVSSFDLEKTINNIRDGNSVNGLLDGFKKIKENREEIVENLGKFEKNLGLFNGLSEKNPLADFGFGRNTDVLSRAKRDAVQNPVHIYRFCQKIDLECCCNDCAESDCESDLPVSLDWSQYIDMPAKTRNSSDDLVAGIITGFAEIRYKLNYDEEVALAAEQLTDCRESLEDYLDWTGAITRLMIQGGFELESEYQADKTDAKCRFDGDKIAVGVGTCYQINIEKENCLRCVLHKYGPVLVGLRKANWDIVSDEVITDCDAVRDTYTPYLLIGYGTASDSEVWWVISPEGAILKILRGVACQDIGMYTFFFDIFAWG